MRLLPFAFGSIVVACSPGTTSPDDASTDAPANDATSDVTQTDAGNDATTDASTDAPSDASSDVDDAGACLLEPLDGSACNAITPAGNDVTPTCMNGTPPTATGGPIANGHYVLASTTYYGDDAGCQIGVSPKTDWIVCGSQWETAAGGNGPYHIDFNATVQSPQLQLQETCGGTLTTNWTYDATQTTLTFHIPEGNGTGARIDVFNKQ